MGDRSPFDDAGLWTHAQRGDEASTDATATWGTASGGREEFAATAAPVSWLFASLGAAALALALVLLLGAAPPAALAAWVLGGPVTIGLTTAFNSADTARRTRLGYGTGRAGLARVLYAAALIVGLSAVIVAAVHLAYWAGRGF